MSNFQITQGSGTTIATETGSGSENYQKIKLIDPTVGSTSPIGNAANPMKVDGSGVTQPISGTISISGTVPVIGTFWQTTQPVSGSVSISNFPATQAVSGTITANAGTGNFTVVQGTGTNLHIVVDSGSVTVSQSTAANLNATVTVSGTPNVSVTNTPSIAQSGTWNITNISGTVSLPTGAATSANQTNGSQKTQLVDGTGDIITISATTGALTVQQVAATLGVTATGAAAASVTLTLPAVASQFHYITLIEIEAYSTAARTGGTTPVLVTSTNLPGNPVWTFSSAAAVGTTDTKLYIPGMPVRSSVVNTATTIVCPATTAIIWRVNVFYYAAV